jgi:hypothetical protein
MGPHGLLPYLTAWLTVVYEWLIVRYFMSLLQQLCNYKLENIAQFKALRQHWPGGNEENHEEHQLE